ncbi:MAG: hypothetical protein ACYSN8_04230 [Planctomycetota bacterium]|jgi:hypothetical protein
MLNISGQFTEFELIRNCFLMALKSARLYNAFMNWKLILILVAGTCFCASSVGYLFVKTILRPKRGGDWEEDYWEFEDQHPAMKRYHFWCRLLFSAVIVSMLLLFVTISV